MAYSYESLPKDDDGYTQSTKGRSRLSTLQPLVFFVLGVAITFIAQAGIVSLKLINIDHICTNIISQPSPLTRDIEIKYTTQKFDGRFVRESIYRKDASPEVDAAWDALSAGNGPVQVPAKDIKKYGFSPSYQHASPQYGGGYFAFVEGLHHLHCLNLLRQTSHWNFEYYQKKHQGAFGNAPRILRLHYTHCLDMLRQQLMCTMDIGILGVKFVKLENVSHPFPFPDFNTEHKCRNFDDIKRWADEHEIPKDGQRPEDYPVPFMPGDDFDTDT